MGEASAAGRGSDRSPGEGGFVGGGWQGVIRRGNEVGRGWPLSSAGPSPRPPSRGHSLTEKVLIGEGDRGDRGRQARRGPGADPRTPPVAPREGGSRAFRPPSPRSGPGSPSPTPPPGWEECEGGTARTGRLGGHRGRDSLRRGRLGRRPGPGAWLCPRFAPPSPEAGRNSPPSLRAEPARQCGAGAAGAGAGGAAGARHAPGRSRPGAGRGPRSRRGARRGQRPGAASRPAAPSWYLVPRGTMPWSGGVARKVKAPKPQDQRASERAKRVEGGPAGGRHGGGRRRDLQGGRGGGQHDDAPGPEGRGHPPGEQEGGGERREADQERPQGPQGARSEGQEGPGPREL